MGKVPEEEEAGEVTAAAVVTLLGVVGTAADVAGGGGGLTMSRLACSSLARALSLSPSRAKETMKLTPSLDFMEMVGLVSSPGKNETKGEIMQLKRTRGRIGNSFPHLRQEFYLIVHGIAVVSRATTLFITSAFSIRQTSYEELLRPFMHDGKTDRSE